MAMPLEKLKKVVEMAKNAPTEGERSNARRIVERECNDIGITVEDAMAGHFIKIKIKTHVENGLNIPDDMDEFGAAIVMAFEEKFRKMRQRQEEYNHRIKQSEDRRRAYMENLRRRAGR